MDFAIEKTEESFSSDTLDLLFTALAKAQGEMEIAKTVSANPYFKSKYADLRSVINASRPYLAKNGLSVIQRVLTNGNGQIYLYTRLGHTSGQWIESKMPISPPKTDIQSIGSYITYLRRYNYACLVGVAAADEDDDGEKAMERNGKKVVFVSEGQIEKIEELLMQLEDGEYEKLLRWAQVKSLEEIPANKFGAIVQALKAKIEKKEVVNGTRN